MLGDVEDIVIQAFEFWCSICDEEVFRIHNNKHCYQYSEKALDMLFEVICHHLLNRRSIDDEDDSWNPVKASSTLLETLAQCTSDKLITLVFNFIGTYLQSPDARIRDSALMVFGSILPSQSSQLKSTIPDGFNTIVPLLSDSNPQVRITVAWCLKMMCENHPSCIANNPEILDTYIRTVYDNLKNSPKIIIYLCDSLHKICHYLKNTDNRIMNNYLITLLSELLRIAYSPNAYDVENNVALAAFFTIGSLVDTAPPEAYNSLSEFFPNIVVAFESTFADSSNFSDTEMRLAYQGYIATNISSFIMERKIPLSAEQAEHLFNIIIKTFKERNTIYEEGIMTLSSLALSLGPSFLPYVKDFGGYLVHGLNNWRDASICRICINGVSDLVRALRDSLEPYIHGLMEKILFILEVHL
jgi:hypothetical protein